MKLSKLKRDWNLCDSKDVEDFERKIRFNLPEDYREFLIEKNGGYLDVACLFTVKQGDISVEEGIEIFYGINSPKIANLSDRFDNYHLNQRRMPDYLIPIGRDQGGNQICMLLNNRMYGYIVFWDRDHEIDFEDIEQASNPLSNCSLIAKSFGGFLEKLK